MNATEVFTSNKSMTITPRFEEDEEEKEGKRRRKSLEKNAKISKNIVLSLTDVR